MEAIVLFSGGLDSAVLLAMALERHSTVLALTFDYGQRHRDELDAADAIARHYSVPHKVLRLDPSAFDKSTLVGVSRAVPKDRSPDDILSISTPSTYVPARNTLFLAYAMGQAEIYGAKKIYFGAMGLDGAYPDCRKPYVSAFQVVIDEAMHRENEEEDEDEERITIEVPLIDARKSTVLAQGDTLRVPFELTFSCYDPPKPSLHCGHCDACFRRRMGFIKSGITDPTQYAAAYCG